MVECLLVYACVVAQLGAYRLNENQQRNNVEEKAYCIFFFFFC